jgi:hypothetical protein
VDQSVSILRILAVVCDENKHNAQRNAAHNDILWLRGDKRYEGWRMSPVSVLLNVVELAEEMILGQRGQLRVFPK